MARSRRNTNPLASLVQIFGPARKQKNAVIKNSSNKIVRTASIQQSDPENVTDRLTEENESQKTDAVKASDQKPTLKAKRKYMKTQIQRDISDSFGSIFSALWDNFVEYTDEFRVQLRIDLAKRGSQDNKESHLQKPMADISVHDLLQLKALKPMLKDAYTLQHIKSKENYAAFIDVYEEFQDNSNIIHDWQQNANVLKLCTFFKKQVIFSQVYAAFRSHGFLQDTDSQDEFVNIIKKMWFEPFTVGLSSRCGFHHVHIGEAHLEKSTMAGMHSWIRYLQLEEKNSAEYLGYYKYKIDIGLASISFRVIGENERAKVKKKSTMLIGVPLEFELLVYSLAVLINPNRQTMFRLKNTNVGLSPKSPKKSGVLTTAYFEDNSGNEKEASK